MMTNRPKLSKSSKIPIPDAALLLALLEGLPDPTAMFDADFEMIGANSAWRERELPDLFETARSRDLSPEERKENRETLEAVCGGRSREGRLKLPPAISGAGGASVAIRGLDAGRRVVVAVLQSTERGKRVPDGLVPPEAETARFETDLEGHIVAWSSNAERLFRRGEEEIVSRHASLLFAKRSFQFPDEDLLAGLRKGRTQRMTLRLRRGSRSFFDGEIVVGIRQAGNGTRLTCEASVLSERQRVGALRRSEERLRYALEAASDGIWDWNILTDRVMFTPRVSEILGSIGGGEGMQSADIDSWNARIHTDDQKANREALGAHFRGRAPAFESEYRLRTDDGRWKWVLVRGRVTERDSNHAPVRMIGTIADVSERKLAQDALRQSEEQYRNLFENASDTVILFDVGDATILDANQKAEEMFGYTNAELKRMTFHQLHPQDHWRRLDTALRSSDARTGTLFELEGLTRTRKRIPVETNVRLIKYGDRLVYQSFIRDISERKTLEAQLRQSQKMETVGRLAGGIAHDFNNILTAIQGYATLLRTGLEEGSEEREMAAEVVRAVQRASRLTTQLLTFSRRDIPNPSRLDLNSIVREMEQMLRQLIGEHIELATVLNPALSPIYGDSGGMEQVITNLVINAADAMPRGGALCIETDNVRFSGVEHVLLSIQDQGEGIAPEMLPQIFEPFFTTKSPGTGTGLGLATVYGIVRRSQGHIEVDSEPGAGTRFRIYLPPSLHETPGQPGIPVRTEDPELRPGTETVLVVEDEPAVRDLAKRFLETSGYTVVEAGDAAGAIEAAEVHRGHIDLLLTDVIMPDLSGPELAKRLREQEPGLKVLYMSGYPGEFIERHGVSRQEKGYLQKPFSQEALALKMREVLDA